MIGRKVNGPAVIDGAIKQFQGIIDKLDTGITACETKAETNAKTIESLTAENVHLGTKQTQATTFRNNLSNMLTQEIPANPTE